MLLSFNIYWDDLTEDAQERLIEDGFLPHENLDCMPLSILEIESDVMYDEDEEYQEIVSTNSYNDAVG